VRAVIVDLLCNSPFYNGALVNALRQSGVEVELASPLFYLEPDYLDPYPRSRWIADLTVHLGRPRALRLGSRVLEFGINFSRLLRAIKAGKYDVVHLEWIPLEDRQTKFMRVLRSACDRAKVPLILTAHNVVPHDTPTVSREVIRRNLELAHLLIAHTEHVAQELRDGLGVRTGIVFVPHGVSFTDLELPPRDRAAAQLGLVGDPVVLFAGIVRPYKGIDLLTEAWPTVRAAFPDAVLVVAGRALGDEAGDQLRRLAALAGVLVADGYVPMKVMLNYHVVSDVVVFPYRSISQSGALMSAVGLGRPAVVTPIPGLVEQAAALRCVAIADEVSGAAIARATISALQDREALLSAAAEDRCRVAQSPVGWPAVGRETARQYEMAFAALQSESPVRQTVPEE
jgi:glycosyltransferase involved in cell wall biosynthesis